MKILVRYIENNRTLLQLAAKHAKAFNSEILVVTPLIGEECKEQNKILEAEQNLEYAKIFFAEQNISSETFLLARGNFEGEILVSFAIENGVEEIILGVKNRSKVGKFIFGSTAQHIILNALCPVTTLRLQ